MRAVFQRTGTISPTGRHVTSISRFAAKRLLRSNFLKRLPKKDQWEVFNRPNRGQYRVFIQEQALCSFGKELRSVSEGIYEVESGPFLETGGDVTLEIGSF